MYPSTFEKLTLTRLVLALPHSLLSFNPMIVSWVSVSRTVVISRMDITYVPETSFVPLTHQP